MSGCHAPTGLATPCLFGSGLCEPTEHVRSEGQSNPEVQLSSSNLWVQGQMRTINGNIKVGGRSRQNQSIGLTHTEGKESLVTVNNHPAHQWQPILKLLLALNVRPIKNFLFSFTQNELLIFDCQRRLTGQSKKKDFNCYLDFEIWLNYDISAVSLC